MSQITTNFILTYKPGVIPKSYGMVVIINNADFDDDPNEEISENGQITTQGLLYTTASDMAAVTNDPVVLIVDFGELQLHQENGEIDFTLFNGSNQIDNKRFKVKDAQDESRPFEK